MDSIRQEFLITNRDAFETIGVAMYQGRLCMRLSAASGIYYYLNAFTHNAQTTMDNAIRNSVKEMTYG